MTRALCFFHRGRGMLVLVQARCGGNSRLRIWFSLAAKKAGVPRQSRHQNTRLDYTLLQTSSCSVQNTSNASYRGPSTATVNPTQMLRTHTQHHASTLPPNICPQTQHSRSATPVLASSSTPAGHLRAQRGGIQSPVENPHL